MARLYQFTLLSAMYANLKDYIEKQMQTKGQRVTGKSRPCRLPQVSHHGNWCFWRRLFLCWSELLYLLSLSPCSDEADWLLNGLWVAFYEQDLDILPALSCIFSAKSLSWRKAAKVREFRWRFVGLCVSGCRAVMVSCSLLSWSSWNPFSFPKGTGHFST